MSLAAILGFYLLSAGWLPPAAHGSVPQTAGQSPAATSSDSSTQQSQDAPASQPPVLPAQNPEPTHPLPSPTAQTPNSPAPAKPSPTRRRRKRTLPSNCSNAPTALNTAAGQAADPPNSTGTGSVSPGSSIPGSTTAGSTTAGSTASKPCPPPKKVVRNGGSNEPTVQLTGGTTAERASEKSSTEQLKAATEENLKKAVGLQLNPTQREMVSQIRQFMQQSKAAVAAGDLARGHDLALKAHLLSDELVKP
jgi:hypothetical protein